MAAPELILQTNTDEGGAWDINVSEQLEPGLHRVIANDESGNTDEALLYVQEPAKDKISIVETVQEYTIDRIQTVIHPIFFWTLLLLVVVIFILAINMVRLGRKVDKSVSLKTEKKRRSFKWALIVAGFATAAVLIIGIVVQQQTNLYRVPFFNTTLPETVNLSGAVITPITKDDVVGVDLTAGDTHIRTQEGARYNFPGMDRKNGIRINHPKLQRSIVIQPLKDEKLDIIFDPDMLNSAIDISIIEAQGHFAKIQPYLITDVAQLTYAQEIGSHRGSIFSTEDINAQEFVISPIVRHENLESALTKKNYGPVFEFYVLNNGQAEQFLFVQEAGKWKILQ